LIILLGVAAFALMVVDATGNLDAIFAFIRAPISTVMEWTATQADPLETALSGPGDLQTAVLEIEALTARVNELELENETLREIQGENQLYEALLNLARETPDYDRVAASVIAYNSSPYFQSIVINAGTNDGVLVGMPVESPRGLIGQVYRTSPVASQVLLVTDNISNIPVRLGSSRATGMLRGGGLGGEMVVEWIELEAPIQPGEVVLTSGVGGRFPEDLVIGRVVEVGRQDSQLHQRAVVRPGTDFDSLEIVFVITQFQAIDATIFDDPPE
jgi:rod shape-determining protein MreC